MDSIYKKLQEAESIGKPSAFCLVVSTSGSCPQKAGSKMIVYSDGTIAGTVGGGSIEHQIIKEAISVIEKGEPCLFQYSLKDDLKMECGGNMSVYIEPLQPKHNLYIFGMGHIGSILARFASEVGFQVTLIDDRPGILDNAAFSEFQKLNIDFTEAVKKLNFDNRSYIVILTYNHIHDFEVLSNVCKQNFKYCGMIGSKRKVAETKRRLIDDGFMTADEISKIDMPIGIKIAGNEPPEIAISILAKLIDVKNS